MNKNKVIRAVAAAGAVSVVPLAFAGTAQASTQSSPDHGHGWVRVCQKIYDYDHHYSYWGDYSIRDSKHRRWDFSLGGRSYDCFTTKVKTGWTKVSVTDYPDHVYTNKHQQDSYWFKVKKGYTYTVTFRFDSYDHKFAPQQVATA